ncbi:MAG: hypothetical protein Q9227_008987 [Pyrenula ochraceoflavens]
MAKSPNLYTFPDTDTLAQSLRKYILQCQTTALSRHDTFKVAVSGGSLPATLAKALLSPPPPPTSDPTYISPSTPQFSHWQIFYADERAVPLDHPDSNHHLIQSELLSKIPASTPQPTVHPINASLLSSPTADIASDYQSTLLSTFASKDSVKLPTFDLLLLGCGPDGHTCSLFPNHPLLRETEAWVSPIDDSPKPPPRRITLTLPVVTAASKIAFVATGAGKKEVLKKILDGGGEEERMLPCALVNEGAGERVSWFTDEGAVEGVGFPRRGSL